jgi:hypothetical protein
MTASRWRRIGGAIVPLALALILGALVFSADAAAAESPATAVSPAEGLLFETDHLAGVSPPQRLEYRYAASGTAPVSDRIVLVVTGGAGRKVEPDYLSGLRHVDFPAVEDAHGNPLLLYFLEQDLREMQREEQASASRMRRLLRLALAAPEVPVDSVAARIDGREVAARRIVVQPFRSDAATVGRFPQLAAKRYEFVLSPAVPGQIVSLATIQPVAGGGERTARVDWTAATACEPAKYCRAKP